MSYDSTIPACPSHIQSWGKGTRTTVKWTQKSSKTSPFAACVVCLFTLHTVNHTTTSKREQKWNKLDSKRGYYFGFGKKKCKQRQRRGDADWKSSIPLSINPSSDHKTPEEDAPIHSSCPLFLINPQRQPPSQPTASPPPSIKSDLAPPS